MSIGDTGSDIPEGVEPSYEEEIKRLEEAERASQHADEQTAWRQNIVHGLRWNGDLHMQAQMSMMPANRIQDVLINQQHEQELLEAGEIVDDPKRESQARGDALTVKAAQERKLDEQSALEYANLQTGIQAAQLTLAGDPQAAQREQFDQEQANQRVALVERYGEGSGQLKAFDQKSALERQELTVQQSLGHQQMQSESARAMADIQGQVNEAQLRAAGNTYEADRGQFVRAGEDKVTLPRQQAAASEDEANEQLLLAQADAQEKANQELMAMDTGHKRQQDMAGAAEERTEGRPALQCKPVDTLQEYAEAPGTSGRGQYVEVRNVLSQQEGQNAESPAKSAADRENAASRIREFVAQTQNTGAGRIMSAEQYGNSLLASALQGNGAAEALGMAGADLKTLGGESGLMGNLGDVGQKLSTAADKWNHIADQLRNVTILTMGR